jgi:16S rRNA G1207 methylase RsmC
VSQNNGASAPPAEEQVQQVEEAAGSGNPSEGNPSAASVAPLSQAQTQAAQNTAQGDAAAPLETGARQRSDTEKQQTAEAKAACEAALAKLNKERQQQQQQQCLREAQELYKCLSSGMDLLTPGQVRQITDAATTMSPWTP